MQTHGGSTAQAEILAAERRIEPLVWADWNRNGQYDHGMSQLSQWLVDVSVDRSLKGSAPEEVLLIEGSSAAELTITLSGTRGGVSAANLFSPFNQQSPLFGNTLVGSEIRYDLVVHTDEGEFIYPQFIGSVRTVTPNRADGTVTITALDRVEKLRRPVRFPNWAIDDYHASRGFVESQLVNTAWVIDHCLRACDVSSTPDRWTFRRELNLDPGVTEGAMLYVTGTGSLLPSVGWMARGTDEQQYRNPLPGTLLYERQGPPHPASPVPDELPLAFTGQGEQAAADLSEPNPGALLRYWAADRDGINPRSTHYMGFTLVNRGPNSEWWRTADDHFVMLVDVGDIFWIMIWIGEDGKLWSNVIDRTDLSVMWESSHITLDQDAEIIPVFVQWDLSVLSGPRVYVSAGDVNTGDWEDVGSPHTGDVVGHQNKGIIQFNPTVAFTDLWFATRNYHSANINPTQGIRPATYAAALDRGMQNLSFVPDDVDGKDAWDLIEAVAAAEYGSVFWDESGRFRFWNYNTMLGKRDEIVRSYTLDHLQNLVFTHTLDSVRNVYSINAQRRIGYTGVCYRGNSPDEFYVPAQTSQTFRIWSNEVQAPNQFELVRYTTNEDWFDVIPEWTDEVQHGYCPQWFIDGEWQDAYRSGLTVNTFFDIEGYLVVKIYNGWLEPVRLTDGNGNAAVRISGTVIDTQDPQIFTLQNPDSVSRFGPRNLSIEGDWIQDRINTSTLSQSMLPRTSAPIPSTDQILVPGDPRIQLGDVVTLRDPSGFGHSIAVQVYGYTRNWSADEGLNDTLSIEVLPDLDLVPEPEPEPIPLSDILNIGTWVVVGANGTMNASRPAGTAIGDFMVAIVQTTYDGNFDALGAPAGWDLVSEYEHGPDEYYPQVKIYSKFVESGEPAYYAFTGPAGGPDNILRLAVWRGVDSSDPFSVEPIWDETAQDADQVFGGVTTLGDKEQAVVYLFGQRYTATGNNVLNFPPTAIWSAGQTTSGTFSYAGSRAGLVPEAGAVPGFTATLNGPPGTPGLSMVYTLKPSPLNGGGGSDPDPGGGDTAAGNFGWGTPIASASDTFNYVGAPNAAKWDVYDGPGHAGNGTRDPERVYVNGEFMRLSGQYNGSSAGMANKYNQLYGRWEVRARWGAMPGATGSKYHPVLIVWPQEPPFDWPTRGEYDFVENDIGDTQVKAWLHYPHPSNVPIQQEPATGPTVDFTEWHNYAFEWTSSGIKGYVDGVQFFSFSGGAGPNGRGPMQGMTPAGHLTIQLDQFHGNSGYQAAYMDIQWVRVYDV